MKLEKFRNAQYDQTKLDEVGKLSLLMLEAQVMLSLMKLLSLMKKPARLWRRLYEIGRTTQRVQESHPTDLGVDLALLKDEPKQAASVEGEKYNNSEVPLKPKEAVENLLRATNTLTQGEASGIALL